MSEEYRKLECKQIKGGRRGRGGKKREEKREIEIQRERERDGAKKNKEGTGNKTQKWNYQG